MDNGLMFSSKNNLWQTPHEVYSLLDMEYHFDCDICATFGHGKHPNSVTPEMDALSDIPWATYGKSIFMNPPYGRGLRNWIQRAWHESEISDIQVVALIPARTDTSYWHDFCMKSSEIGLVRGRISFLDEHGAKTDPAPFPSAIVVFNRVGGSSPILTAWSF